MEYCYLSAIKEDVKNYIDDEITISDFSDRDELESYLNDELWTCDSVTGNVSGSYTMNRLMAREYVIDNIDELDGAVENLGIDKNIVGERFLNEDFEWCDVIIRCSLLSSAIGEVLDSMEQNNELDFDNGNE
jgi:hypothetical protein